MYNIDNINLTKDDFSNIADIIVSDNNKYWICEFINSKASIERTIIEFENYLIDLSNKKGI